MTQSTVEGAGVAGSTTAGSAHFHSVTSTLPVTMSSSSPSSQLVGISKEFRISAAHHLPNHKGKCKHVHGHNYRIRLTLTGKVDPASGMVKDFYDIEGDFEKHIALFDHQDLNFYYPNPTAENLAVAWLTSLKVTDDRYTSVTVWETDDCFAEATSYSPNRAYPDPEQGRGLEHFPG